MGYGYTDKASFECRLGKILSVDRGDRELSGMTFKHLLTSVSHLSLMVTLSKYSHYTNESSMVWEGNIKKYSPRMFK